MDSQCTWAWPLQHYPLYPMQLSILPYQNSHLGMCHTAFCVQQPVKFPCFWVVLRNTALLIKCSGRPGDLKLFNYSSSIIWEIQRIFLFPGKKKKKSNLFYPSHWRNLKYQKCVIFERFIRLWKCCKWQRRGWRGKFWIVMQEKGQRRWWT